MEILERLRMRFSKELYRLLGWTLRTVLETFTGYAEPRAGSPAAALFTFSPVRSLWFFIVPSLGGLVSRVIVYLVAPEAEGHGTDAMIDAFNHRGDRSGNGCRS